MATTWLEDKIGKVLADQQRKQMMKAEAPKLFDSVWNEIKAIGDEADNAGYNIFFTGNQERRIVRLGHNRFVSQTESGSPDVVVFLSADNQLQVTGDVTQSPVFVIDVCPEDRVVCLKLNGSRVSPKEAAEKIMERLLFSKVPAALA